MDKFENAVAAHYRADGLLERIDAGLRAGGADPARLTPEDLAPVDEFHVGGREATVYAISRMSLSAADHVLDVGCGLGGAARYVATKFGCSVAGIDLTPEFIDVARALTARLGLEGLVRLETASALAMPFADGAFDAAYSFHVAMNIPDRAGLYREIARVMRPAGRLCIYDIMKTGPGDVVYPVPWAETADTSHLTSPAETRALLEEAGFEVGEIEDRREFALQFFRQRLGGGVGDGPPPPPPLGIHLVMGGTWREKFKNTLENTAAGRIAPVQMIASRKAA
jgi:SAM-dependent methyltransferase